eukprot:426800-Hanusia_phi.AAC.2
MCLVHRKPQRKANDGHLCKHKIIIATRKIHVRSIENQSPTVLKASCFVSLDIINAMTITQAQPSWSLHYCKRFKPAYQGKEVTKYLRRYYKKQ